MTKIISDPEIMGGIPCIDDTRIPVVAVMDFHREGFTAPMIKDQYPNLSIEQINDVIDRWPLLKSLF
jgi:uncharacterized protein (DUF433 family)